MAQLLPGGFSSGQRCDVRGNVRAAVLGAQRASGPFPHPWHRWGERREGAVSFWKHRRVRWGAEQVWGKPLSLPPGAQSDVQEEEDEARGFVGEGPWHCRAQRRCARREGAGVSRGRGAELDARCLSARCAQVGL